MATKQYWLRMRDKIYGPFDANAIREMAGAGTLRREMEISNDESTWHVAGNVEGLFPAKALNDFASSSDPTSIAPPPLPVSEARQRIEAASEASPLPLDVGAAAAEEDGGSRLAAWIAVGVAAVALFYFGGGEIVWNRSWLSVALTQGVGNILTDGLVINDRFLVVRFNEGIYGFAIAPRFFDSPVLSWALVSASAMCAVEFFRKM